MFSIAGTGYVGLSMASLLAQHNQVTAVDIVPDRVDLVNNRISPIQDDYIEQFFLEKQLDLSATTNPGQGYRDAEFVMITTPTNYDSQRNFFDTSAVQSVIQQVTKYNPNAIMVIKSTVPVGFTDYARTKYKSDDIFFSPEFLRESKALYDNLYPSRIIVWTDISNPKLLDAAHKFASQLQKGAIKIDIPTLFMGLIEAVKLFANRYDTILDDVVEKVYTRDVYKRD